MSRAQTFGPQYLRGSSIRASLVPLQAGHLYDSRESDGLSLQSKQAEAAVRPRVPTVVFRRSQPRYRQERTRSMPKEVPTRSDAASREYARDGTSSNGVGPYRRPSRNTGPRVVAWSLERSPGTIDRFR